MKVSPNRRLQLIDRVHETGPGSVRAARALVEGLNLESLEDLLGVVCIHTALTPDLFDVCADAMFESNYSKDHP